MDLQVVADPKGKELEPAKALQITLENGIQSQDGVFVNGVLPVAGGGADGVLHIQLRAGDMILENQCLVNAWSARPENYFYLAPGSALKRVVKLGCYNLPRDVRVSASVTYEDPVPQTASPAQPDDVLGQSCPQPGGLPRVDVADVFRGRIVSNKVDFAVGDP